MQFTPVKELAVKYSIPVLQPVKLKNDDVFFEELKALKPDVIVVIAFGQILPDRVLELPKYGCINIHASLLPKYRGAAPIQWAILNGEKETGVTTMMMDSGLDTGDMILRKVIPIEEKETGGSLFDKLAYAGGDLIIETLKQAEAGTLKRIPQNNDESNYVSIIKKEYGRMDFTKSALELERLIRGLNPWPSAFTSLHGKTLKVWDADVVETVSEEKPGTILSVDKDSFTVMTGEGALKILELQLEGKKRMMTEAFLRGYKLETGEMLG